MSPFTTTMLGFNEVLERAKSVNALLTEEEKKVFVEYASKVPDNGIIVDIGTARGGSAFIFALASPPSVKVYTVDPVSNQHFFSARERLGLEDKLIFINKPSKEAVGDVPIPIDLLFIDGVHSRTGVAEDFESYGKNVLPEGFAMFHDYFYYDGIKAAVDELEEDGRIKKHLLVDSLFQGERRTGLFIAKVL